MSSSDSLRWLKQPMLSNYGVAVLSVFAALIIGLLLQAQYGFEPFVLFLCAMMLSAWFGGIKPGLVALTLSLAAFHYYFLIPIYSSGLEPEMPRFLVVGVTSLFVVGLSASQRSSTEALRESKQRFISLFQNMAEGVAYLKMLFEDGQPRDAVYLEVNAAWVKLTGLKNVVGRTTSEVTPGIRQDSPIFFERCGRVAVTGLPERFEIYSPLLKKWLSVSAYSPKNEHVAVVLDDVTERKLAEEALRQRESDLAEAQRVARLGNWSLDIAGNKVRWSEELHRIFDVEKTAFSSTFETFLSRVHPNDRDRVLQTNAEARSSGEPFELEYRIETRDGQQKHIRELGYARTDAAGAISGLFGIAQDITERKEAENALQVSSVQLQALSRRLVELQESERKELARELHDRIGQNLTALNINLNILETMLPLQSADEPRTRLADSKVLVQSTTAAIGNILSELRPPMLDEHGLAHALDWYAGQVSARTGVAVTVRELGQNERLAPEAEIALFRIAQEALNNVFKHARASHVEISLEQVGSEYVMFLQDNGAGFDVVEERSAPRPGLGMASMRERAQAVGGRFEFSTRSGNGTRLTVRIPA